MFVEMRKMLNQETMKDKANPEKLFAQLESIRNVHEDSGMNCDEADLMAVVVTVAPKKHQSLLSSMQLDKKTC